MPYFPKFIGFLLLLSTAYTSTAQDISGDYYGVLKPMHLNLVIHITKNNEGYEATLDSPDQGAFGIPADSVYFKGESLVLAVDRLNARKEGSFEANSLKGTFTQNGFSITFDMLREKSEKQEARRLQEPLRPFGYLEEEVSFTNGENLLSGTLTLPDRNSKHPAVILVNGSGPQDRNQAIAGHKPFLVLADHLTKNGIAVLRYDDRGFGKSTGNFDEATAQEFSTDVQSAVRFLKSRKDIDGQHIGFIGHSEGGLIE